MNKLRHVVLFKFKDSSSPETIQQLEQAFKTFATHLPEVHDFEWGHNNSPEGLNDGFSHCFLVTFLTEADRNAYLPHPKHQEFVTQLQPHLEKVCVLDYWAQS
ncbi:MAG: Dabb family protein [Trueperaceae bacterium]|nr:Dabb family protein [Trueperaceae bacterium]